jgi:hypothetical protein
VKIWGSVELSENYAVKWGNWYNECCFGGDYLGETSGYKESKKKGFMDLLTFL